MKKDKKQTDAEEARWLVQVVRAKVEKNEEHRRKTVKENKRFQ